MGTTATGKSSLAVNLAQKINAEIISADSRQVFRGYNIATAKSTLTEMGGIKHYLIDVLDPDEDFSAGVFVDMAKKAIKEIANKNKTPILAGGTGMYLKMLLDGIDMPIGKPNVALRKELQQILEDEGNEKLYSILCELDREFAKKLHPNDSYKVMRAIEILKTTNKPMSESRGKKEKEFDVLKIALGAKNREIIYERINSRVDKMIQIGLEKEAFELYQKNPESKLFNSTIGYQEFIPYFNQECDLKTVVEKIKQNTRRYAKRQLTWFRAQQDINWFFIDEMPITEIENKAFELCKNFL